MVGRAMEMSLAVTQTSAVIRQRPTRDHQRRSVRAVCRVGPGDACVMRAL